MDIILASASPRRQELLGYVFDDFRCIPADIEETLPNEISAENSAEYLACQKSAHVAKAYPDSLVIGCDTVVVCDNEIFGKPSDEAQAEKMLRRLSGREHLVITGVCFFLNGRKHSFSEVTRVEFFPLTVEEIADYIKTGSPMDKAGAYGIQDKSFLPAKRIDGDYFNVVGLPIARLKREADSFLR